MFKVGDEVEFTGYGDGKWLAYHPTEDRHLKAGDRVILSDVRPNESTFKVPGGAVLFEYKRPTYSGKHWLPMASIKLVGPAVVASSCTCSIDVLMARGCQCGHMQRQGD
jgi:hypothetical protein